MKLLSLTFLLAAFAVTNAGAQSLMGRPQTSASPAASPSPSKTPGKLSLLSKPKAVAPKPHRTPSRQVQKQAAVTPVVDAPVITAIYRGPGTFDQRLFDDAVAAADAVGCAEPRREAQSPSAPVVSPVIEPRQPEPILPEPTMKAVDSLDPREGIKEGVIHPVSP